MFSGVTFLPIVDISLDELTHVLRYMLRYLKAVQMMKQVLEEKNLTVMSTIARYATAYSVISKPDWWDKSKRFAVWLVPCPEANLIYSYGPIIEQATHFCSFS